LLVILLYCSLVFPSPRIVIGVWSVTLLKYGELMAAIFLCPITPDIQPVLMKTEANVRGLEL